jgi:hypothetical protein
VVFLYKIWTILILEKYGEACYIFFKACRIRIRIRNESLRGSERNNFGSTTVVFILMVVLGIHKMHKPVIFISSCYHTEPGHILVVPLLLLHKHYLFLFFCQCSGSSSFFEDSIRIQPKISMRIRISIHALTELWHIKYNRNVLIFCIFALCCM